MYWRAADGLTVGATVAARGNNAATEGDTQFFSSKSCYDVFVTMVACVRFSKVVLVSLLAFLLAFIANAQNAEVSKPSDCPQISVVGPAGVSMPGELIWFRVNLNPEPTSELKFHWTTDAGQVDEGQSTKRIGVRYLMGMRGTTLTATVKIEGLTSHCQNMASDGAPLIWDPGPELLSEFSVPLASIHIRYLRAAAAELVRNPNNQMYIIEYFPPRTSESSKTRKRNRIRSFMGDTLRFDVSRITIVTSEADRPLTKIYRIPPGAANPNP